ncbi:hypothetical protein D3C73_641810 [compost metagenome]
MDFFAGADIESCPVCFLPAAAFKIGDMVNRLLIAVTERAYKSKDTFCAGITPPQAELVVLSG